MNKFIILFFVAVLFFPSCSQINPIVEDVCDITAEICYYANLVCENFIPHEADNKNDLYLKQTLSQAKSELMLINSSLNNNQTDTKIFSDADLKIKLLDIRNRLKSIYELQKIRK